MNTFYIYLLLKFIDYNYEVYGDEVSFYIVSCVVTGMRLFYHNIFSWRVYFPFEYYYIRSTFRIRHIMYMEYCLHIFISLEEVLCGFWMLCFHCTFGMIFLKELTVGVLWWVGVCQATVNGCGRLLARFMCQ